MIVNLTKKQFKGALRLLDDEHMQFFLCSEAAKAAVAPIRKEIQNSFEKLRSPNDESWKALKKKKAGRNLPVLAGLKNFNQTGLTNPTTVYSTNEKWYAKFHYTGTKFMPARRSLPFPGEPVQEWQKRVGKVIYKALTPLIKDMSKGAAKDFG